MSKKELTRTVFLILFGMCISASERMTEWVRGADVKKDIVSMLDRWADEFLEQTIEHDSELFFHQRYNTWEETVLEALRQKEPQRDVDTAYRQGLRQIRSWIERNIVPEICDTRVNYRFSDADKYNGKHWLQVDRNGAITYMEGGTEAFCLGTTGIGPQTGGMPDLLQVVERHPGLLLQWSEAKEGLLGAVEDQKRRNEAILEFRV